MCMILAFKIHQQLRSVHLVTELRSDEISRGQAEDQVRLKDGNVCVTAFVCHASFQDHFATSRGVL